MDEIMIRSEMKTYENKELNRLTQKVYKIGEEIRKGCFITAAIFAQVKKSGIFKEAGYKNISEWGKEAFGFSKSTTYNLVNIGENFIRGIENENGKLIGYHSELTEDDEQDYTISQIIPMLPVGLETAEDLHQSGEISPAMSTREIKKVIDEKIKADKEAEETEEAEDEDASETETEEADNTVYVIVTDANGNVYRVPGDILNEYKVMGVTE